MAAALALTAGSVVMAGVAPAQAACQASQTVSTTPNWSANCLTSTTSNKNSNLTLAIQHVLSGRLYDVGATDGIFGTKTRDAVIQFQRDNNLTADGKVGSATWKALAKKIRLNTSSASAYEFMVIPIGEGGGELFRLNRTGVNKGRWEVIEHQPGCGAGGDGFTLMNSTRDCG